MAGKGGVGKTTVAASMATAASHAGLSVLLVEVAGKSATAPLFGVQPQGYDEVTVLHEADRHRRINLRSLTPDHALREWLDTHGFGRFVNRLNSVGILDVIATATPGIKDLLVLGRIKALEHERAADLIVVDAPSAGQAIEFLRSPAGVRDAARTGVLNRQANEILELISDPQRCQVVLTTLAEETPVNETIETSFAIEDELGVRLGPVVVNGVLPDLAGLDDALHSPDPGLALTDQDWGALTQAGRFRQERTALQAEQIARLSHHLPLDQLRLPMLFTPSLGPQQREHLAIHLTQQLELLPSATEQERA